MNDTNPDMKACSRHSGPDCRFLTSALLYWCTNKACAKLRGTTIPGIINCSFYEPGGGTITLQSAYLAFVAGLVVIVLALIASLSLWTSLAVFPR